MKVVDGIYQFIGTDSLGYVYGKKYNLETSYLSFANQLFLGHTDWKIAILKPYECPYVNEIAFFNSWKKCKL